MFSSHDNIADAWLYMSLSPFQVPNNALICDFDYYRWYGLLLRLINSISHQGTMRFIDAIENNFFSEKTLHQILNACKLFELNSQSNCDNWCYPKIPIKGYQILDIFYVSIGMCIRLVCWFANSLNNWFEVS